MNNLQTKFDMYNDPTFASVGLIHLDQHKNITDLEKFYNALYTESGKLKSTADLNTFLTENKDILPLGYIEYMLKNELTEIDSSEKSQLIQYAEDNGISLSEKKIIEQVPVSTKVSDYHVQTTVKTLEKGQGVQTEIKLEITDEGVLKQKVDKLLDKVRIQFGYRSTITIKNKMNNILEKYNKTVNDDNYVILLKGLVNSNKKEKKQLKNTLEIIASKATLSGGGRQHVERARELTELMNKAIRLFSYLNGEFPNQVLILMLKILHPPAATASGHRQELHDLCAKAAAMLEEYRDACDKVRKYVPYASPVDLSEKFSIFNFRGYLPIRQDIDGMIILDFVDTQKHTRSDLLLRASERLNSIFEANQAFIDASGVLTLGEREPKNGRIPNLGDRVTPA